MVDGTGMCGGCRVLVGGERKFACVDGPEFDAHAVDFTNLTQRNRMYRQQEQAALERFQAESARDAASRRPASCSNASRSWTAQSRSKKAITDRWLSHSHPKNA